MGNIYGYARVSTRGQNEERQIQAINQFCESNGLQLTKIYVDKQSGKNFDRPQYQILRYDSLRKGDTLIVKEMDRLGRNKEMIKQELESFKKNGIRVMILDIPTTLQDIGEGQEWLLDMINNILIEVYSTLAENERVKIKKRQAEGIELARKEGKHLGRPIQPLPKNFKKVYDQWKNDDISAVQAMKLVDMKKATFYRKVKEYELRI